MHKTMKAIKHGLEQPLKQYAQEMESGKQMTEKDADRLANLTIAMCLSKLLCMLEEMKEGGEKEGKGGMGGVMHAMGKSMGGQGGNNPMMAMMNTLLPNGLPNIGFTMPGNSGIASSYGDHQPMEGRRGVPGTGTRSMYDNYNNYGEMDDMNDMEMRRGRSRSTGRYVHRADIGEGMNDTYDMNYGESTQNRQGQPGTGSGSGSGSTGGNTGRR